MEKAVRESLDELNIKNANVIVEDFGALDFVIKGRTKTAIERAMGNGGKNL
jgi:citrate lyase subunit gamma (acyl carrier protein)